MSRRPGIKKKDEWLKGEKHPREDSDIVYGLRPVSEALRSRARKVRKITIAVGAKENRFDELIQVARTAGILVDKVPRESLDRLAGRDANHQGIIAHVSAAEYAQADDIFAAARRPELLVLLDGVEDPRNLGAIIRSAEAAGADGVFLTERRSATLTDTAVKASAGAVEHLKVAKVANLNRLIEELKERNIWVVGSTGAGSSSYTEWDWTLPTALILGSEGSGLHRLVSEKCDALVRIPMYGKMESLNVSVAAGVILFEARRQRAEGE